MCCKNYSTRWRKRSLTPLAQPIKERERSCPLLSALKVTVPWRSIRLRSEKSQSDSTEDGKNRWTISRSESKPRLIATACRKWGLLDLIPSNGTWSHIPPSSRPVNTFDGKGSPNQHVYYFKSQTGNVVANNTILARLFIGILKR